MGPPSYSIPIIFSCDIKFFQHFEMERRPSSDQVSGRPCNSELLAQAVYEVSVVFLRSEDIRSRILERRSRSYVLVRIMLATTHDSVSRRRYIYLRITDHHDHNCSFVEISLCGRLDSVTARIPCLSLIAGENMEVAFRRV